MENKIIEYDDRIIGLGEDVADYMQNELKRIINRNYVFDLIYDLEFFKNAFMKLEKYKDKLVSLKENPMGGYNIEVLEVE